MKRSLIFLCFIVCSSTVHATVSTQYYPNYKINQSRKQINDDLVQIKALSVTADKISPWIFSRLNTNLRSVFPAFPQNSDYKVIYQQCLNTTQKLSTNYTYADFTDFLNFCYEKLAIIQSEIQSSYTVNAQVVANPKSGPAPMTVTFDARSSVDPSKDTIPRNNYFWRFKDIDGIEKIIWVWPVINYTFTKPWNYVVHLTVRSVNQSQWYFDGDTNVTVDVAPQSAVITIFANGKRLIENGFIKLGTTEAALGVVFDATATTPTWWRRIIKHRRELKWDGTSYETQAEWSPTVLKRSLPSNGDYTVSLTTTDNEWNELTKKYRVIVSDPVAIIRPTPDFGTTSTRFVFDGSSSYAVSARLKNYKREIFDPSNNLIQSYTQKQISQTFLRPWPYTIKLTVIDELGQSNIDQFKLFVESTDPLPQFTIVPTQERDLPSQFILDASSSSDYDTAQWDSLTYERKFDGQTIKIEQWSPIDQRIVVTPTEAKPFTARLIVKDKYGKSNEISKVIDVKSSLRPSLTMSPQASVRWNDITFVATVNKPASAYQWNFGDGNTRITNDWTITHSYAKVGIYPVSLTVSTPNGETNTIRSRAFIWESNEPIVVYTVQRDNIWIIPVATCRINNKDEPAFDVNRYQVVKIDATSSVNVRGEQSNLKTYYKPQNDEIFRSPTLDYRFATLWCQYVDISVEDPIQWSIVKQRAYFRVRNAMPKLDNLTISFPQYGNDVWVWFMQAKRIDPSFETMDPLIVRLNANWAIDPDWQISYFSWYYYKTDNPDRILDVKITPWNVPSVTFGLSKEAGEYAFWVKIVDNDEEGQRSEDIIWRWPVVFLKPKWADSNDIPIVTLVANRVSAKVWEDIVFKTQSRILSDREDFAWTRIFKYDFDGDWFDDLTTRLSEVTYRYSKPSSVSWPYQPKVKVMYRDKVGVGSSEPIVVKKWIIPKFIFSIIDRTIIVKDISFGVTWSTSRLFCMDMKKCKTDSSYLKTETWFVFMYPDYGKYIMKLELKDEFDNVEWYREIIELKPGSWDVIATPAVVQTASWLSISVWNSLDNTISVYVPWTWCSIDTNTTLDTNKDSNPSNDADIPCSQYGTVTFDSTQPRVSMLVFGTKNLPITVELLDNQIPIPAWFEESVKVIDSLISQHKWKNQLLVSTLKDLKSNLSDKWARSANLIDLKAVALWSQLDTGSRVSVDQLITTLWWWSVSAAFGGTIFDQAKADILKLVDTQSRQTLSSLFEKFDANAWNKELQTQNLNEILMTVQWLAQKNQFDVNDVEIVRLKLCDIANYKELQTKSCWEVVVSTWDIQAPVQKSWSWRWIIRILVYIVWWAIVIFVGAIVRYAIKAKQNQNAIPPSSTPAP